MWCLVCVGLFLGLGRWCGNRRGGLLLLLLIFGNFPGRGLCCFLLRIGLLLRAGFLLWCAFVRAGEVGGGWGGRVAVWCMADAGAFDEEG